MVVLALAFWLGREVTIPAAIVRQVGFAHAATPGMIVARIGFAHSLIEPYGALHAAFSWKSMEVQDLKWKSK